MTVALQTQHSDRARLTATSTLQKLLPELVALSLDAKQAHWNVTGPAFLPLHALTDEIAADARAWADRVAERAVAAGVDQGFAVDARPGAVAATASLFPTGRLTDQEAITELIALVERVAATARDTLGDLDQTDPVAHNLTLEILEGLDKYRWMLRAQTM
ncbi:MAG: ferritin-like domain-containing protein [Acidimicrobiales bacterium]